MPRTRKIPFKWPRHGVHRGEATAFQPGLTTGNALNVRTVGSTDRAGGGKRSGMARAFSQRLAVTHLDGSRKTRILHMTEMRFNSGLAATTEAVDVNYIVAFVEGDPDVDPLDKLDKFGGTFAGRLGSNMYEVPRQPGDDTQQDHHLVGPNIETMWTFDPRAESGKVKVFAVDGDDSIIVSPVLDLDGTPPGSIANWKKTVDAVAANQEFPEKCALTAIYGGRAILARQPESNRAWFASRVLNALDWRFGFDSPTEGGLVTAAVDGSTDSGVGQPGDGIKALITYEDDYLVFGCTGSMWYLVGDPGYGGRILNMKATTGILDSKAWCFDDKGNLWFMGTNGLNVWAGPGQKPENISKLRAVGELDRIDTTQIKVQLCFDNFKRAVHIFLTPRDGTSRGEHWVYETDVDALWPDRYPLVHGPWSCTQITGPSDQDRRFLIGGDDGYIRRPLDKVFGDDLGGEVTISGGVEIESMIEVGYFEYPDGEMESMAFDLNVSFGQSSDPVDWFWFGADSPDEVRQQEYDDAVASGTFT